MPMDMSFTWQRDIFLTQEVLTEMVSPSGSHDVWNIPTLFDKTHEIIDQGFSNFTLEGPDKIPVKPKRAR